MCGLGSLPSARSMRASKHRHTERLVSSWRLLAAPPHPSARARTAEQLPQVEVVPSFGDSQRCATPLLMPLPQQSPLVRDVMSPSM